MNESVLIVEDDPDGQALVSHIVNYLNMPYNIVANAEDAEQHLFESGNIYRAVIIDLGLPGKSGWELLEEIRMHPATETLTCIAVTAFHTSKTREEALRLGFNAYFSKPLDANNLAQELERLL